MLKDGLFKNYNVKFSIDCSAGFYHDPTDMEVALINSINKNKEVAGLLDLAMGDYWVLGKCRYTPRFIFGILCFTKMLLVNQLVLSARGRIKNAGVLSKEILNGAICNVEGKKNIRKLPLETTAQDVYDCLCVRNKGFYYCDKTTIKYNLKAIYISHEKVYKILCVFERVGSNNRSVTIMQNAVKEIDEVLNTMINDKGRFGFVTQNGDITCHACSDDVFNFNREQVIKGIVEGGAMEDNTQTLTLNRPKQQENKLLTVGNKKAYTVGNGDYKHRNGVIKDGCVIKEEKKEMGGIFNALHIEDKDILADLEDLLNNVIDNPDTVDSIVNCLAKNAPAAHFISEMIGCGEIYNEESLLKFLDNAYMLSRKIRDAVGEVTIPPYYEARIGKYLNVAYPKPAFGKEFSLMQFECGFDDARHKIANIIAKAKEEEEEAEALEEIIADAAQAQAKEIEDILDGVEAEEQEEEKEEVITHDAVQEHAEEDCEEYPADLEELQKLLEERRKKEAELDAEIKQAEEEARRKELVEQLLAADNRIKEKEERLAQLRKK